MENLVAVEWPAGRQEPWFLRGGSELGPPLRVMTPDKGRQPWEGESMKQLKSAYRLLTSSRGQTMAEYALILATIALVSVALVQSAGTILTTLVHTVVNLFG